MTSVGKNGFVEFRFFRPDVRSVAIVGDFKSWPHGTLDMQPQEEGWWAAAARLGPGEYRFRYMADGIAYPDYASNGVEKGKTGYDSVLVVPKIRALVPAQDADRHDAAVRQVA